jgi:hypothetical protein
MRGKIMALAACVLVAGCTGGGSGDAPPAASNTLGAGPAEVATPTAGPGIPTPTTDPAAPPTAAPGKDRIQTIEAFEALLTKAIFYKKRKGAPALTVQRKKGAQYQFIVRWQVSDTPGDPVAAELARYDATRILNFIKNANLPVYGSVVLVVSAKLKDAKNGALAVTQVVKAKYVVSSVKTKKFVKDTVWIQADGKPATINPFFK